MGAWKIAIVVVVAIAVLLVLCIWYIKKKIRNKIIDIGTDIVKKTSGDVLDEKTASKVNEAADVTAKIAKGGKIALIAMAAKKGLELARGRKKASRE